MRTRKKDKQNLVKVGAFISLLTLVLMVMVASIGKESALFAPKATVDHLHAMGKKVICYIDAGVYETYRSDAYKFQELEPRIWGEPDIGWNGSYWLDIRRIAELIYVPHSEFIRAKLAVRGNG